GDWPYLWLDATYVKVRATGRIVSVAVIVAVAVNSDGRREVLGIAIGASEAGPRRAGCGEVLEDTATEVDLSVLGKEIDGMTVRDFDPHPRTGLQTQVKVEIRKT